jgi:hypothetical protein
VRGNCGSEHFSVLILKVSHSKFWLLNLFLDIWVRNPDPDSEYGSWIQAQIECGSNRIRIQNTGHRMDGHLECYRLDGLLELMYGSHIALL